MMAQETPDYGYFRDLPDTDYEEAVGRVAEALKAEGFGILTEIDVKATLKKKLDVEFPRYIILGACNPPFAHKALTAEPWIGLFMPCNVVVTERDGGGSTVAVINPQEMFKLVDKPEMEGLSAEVGVMLQAALARI